MHLFESSNAGRRSETSLVFTLTLSRRKQLAAAAFNFKQPQASILQAFRG
jgi:hypothetical protein